MIHDIPHFHEEWGKAKEGADYSKGNWIAMQAGLERMAMDNLLYVLEKVKAACAREHGIFHTTVGHPDHEDCLVLERDGLIRRVNSSNPNDGMWEYPG